jgi:hypothetical protein
MRYKFQDRPEVRFTLTCEPETDVDYRGDLDDPKAVRWVKRQLDKGNEWAWCMVTVTATFGDFEGNAYLGACSYRSESDFKKMDGYYPGLCDEALEDLDASIVASLDTLPPHLLAASLASRTASVDDSDIHDD